VIVVDSNVWADFFNGADTPHVARLDLALEREEDIGTLPIIITEVLQGFRTDTGFQRARRVLTALPLLEPGLAGHVDAARLLRKLRQRGVTIRSSVDCIIAQACIDARAELLSPDADFRQIAGHSTLRLWEP